MRVLAIVHEADAGLGVFAEVVRARGLELFEWFIPGEPSAPERADAVITLGGGMHVDQEDAHPWLASEKTLLAALLERGVAVLGVCLGAQLLAEAAGARARPARRPEVGWHDVALSAEAADDPLLGPLAPGFQALEWHTYEFPLPRKAVPLASSATCLQAFRIGRAAWGIQFHAEATLHDYETWIDHERSPEETARLGFDPERLRVQTRASIAAWNRLGRDLCARFLDAAERTTKA
jgi:GMP synthase (glutamine-hydrolysing)